MKSTTLKGTGLGFRQQHAEIILSEKPEIPWFELLIDNYMAANASLNMIDRLVENYPISFHGVGLSIGSVDPIDLNYLSHLKRLKNRWQPFHISDHFAWTGFGENQFNELLPLPMTRETIKLLSEKIEWAQEYLGDQIVFENASTYIQAPYEMTEWEFINSICSASGCGLLLDINNIHVNAFNHGFDPNSYLEGIELSHVKEIHLAGYEDRGDYYFDSHSEPVSPAVWISLQKVLEDIPNSPMLLEWDNNIPSLEVLIREVSKAEKIRQSIVESIYSKEKMSAI